MKSLTELWSDPELVLMPPGATLWNPFAGVVDDPQGRMNARRWVELHDGPGGGPVREPQPEVSLEPLDDFLAALDDSLGDAPYHLITDPKTN